jgi:hypothetical protein
MVFKKNQVAWNKGLKTGMAPWRGKKLSEDTKKKLSEVHRENWKKGKEKINTGTAGKLAGMVIGIKDVLDVR